MAEETQKPAEEVVVVAEAEKSVTEKPVEDKKPDEPVPEVTEKPAEEPEKPAVVEEVVVAEAEKPKITQSVSFKEESNVVSELPEAQKKALDELKQLIQESLNKHEEPKTEEKTEGEAPKEEATPVVEEPPKAEAETVTEEKREEEKPTPEPVVVTEVVEKATVEEDGTKTVEAIKESIVSVSEEAPAEAPSAAPEPKPEVEEVVAPPPEEVSIWGIPLLADERSDVILLKFLRARDFKVKDAFTMIKNTARWRKEFGIDALVEEDLGTDWDKLVFTHGFDKEGHPVCYNVFGEFENKELYQKTFSDEEKRQKFIRWRIQFLEKSVRKFDYTPTGIVTIVQVNDLKNSPGLGKRELRQATNQALQLFQDNYPEFVAKQVFVNVPWWYLAFSRMISPFLTQRTKSKFVFAGPSKSAETLFKYIAPEQVPVQYGGLSKEGENEFTTADPATEFIIKPSTKHIVEFPVSETSNLVWEVRVVGWDVNYGAEFVPSAEDKYTVIVQKSRKITAADETVISNSFKVGEPGKVVLTFDNQTSKKKKLLYRFKTKPISE
ncbi:patellin-3-like [Senna tora]|uniref:Patellin-3-like n=1 Tax=Senna tora TaxID=362788 RepID=A0A835CCX0_9FABA|nr:patellin-3-like [Senna tora]